MGRLLEIFLSSGWRWGILNLKYRCYLSGGWITTEPQIDQKISNSENYFFKFQISFYNAIFHTMDWVGYPSFESVWILKINERIQKLWLLYTLYRKTCFLSAILSLSFSLSLSLAVYLYAKQVSSGPITKQTAFLNSLPLKGKQKKFSKGAGN